MVIDIKDYLKDENWLQQLLYPLTRAEESLSAAKGILKDVRLQSQTVFDGTQDDELDDERREEALENLADGIYLNSHYSPFDLIAGGETYLDMAMRLVGTASQTLAHMQPQQRRVMSERLKPIIYSTLSEPTVAFLNRCDHYLEEIAVVMDQFPDEESHLTLSRLQDELQRVDNNLSDFHNRLRDHMGRSIVMGD